MLPDLPTVPPWGPTIDIIFKLGGGRYQTHRQCPQGARHQHLATTSVVDAVRPTGSAPRGSAIDVFLNLGGGRC
jgi:hypothetical protein